MFSLRNKVPSQEAAAEGAGAEEEMHSMLENKLYE